MTIWTDFIKEWASKNNLSYGCAMSDPALRVAYYKKYPKRLTFLKEQKAKQAKKDTFREEPLPKSNFDFEKIQKEVSFLPPKSIEQQKEQQVFKDVIQSKDIDKLVEETIMDIFYDKFPDFMKSSTFTKEKIYKDKFLSKSQKEQDTIRKQVKVKLLRELF